MSHTLGEWHCGLWRENGNLPGVPIIKDNGLVLAHVWFNRYDQLPLEAKANARLIAAAPDLLEALKRVCSHGYRSSPDWDNARAAITKAEGV